MRWLLAYFVLLLGGLTTMLVDGLGLFSFLVYYAGMPLGAVAIWRLNGRSIAALFRRDDVHSLRRALIGAVSAAAAVCVVFGALAALGWATLEGSRAAIGRFVLILGAQQVLVAGFEELAFRGVIQTLLVDQLGLARGLAGAAGLFGLFHLPNLIYQDVPASLIPVALGNLTVMGLVFGAAFERGGRKLALPVGLHLGWNMAAYGIEDGFGLRLSGPALFTGDPAWFPESGIAALIGLALAGWLAWTLTGRGTRQATLRRNKRLA